MRKHVTNTRFGDYGLSPFFCNSIIREDIEPKIDIFICQQNSIFVVILSVLSRYPNFLLF